MRRLLTAAALALLTMTTAAHARELPACDAPDVKSFIFDNWQPREFFELKDWQSSTDGKRWCYAFYTTNTRFMETIFTLEWINDAEGRWFLQPRQSHWVNGMVAQPRIDALKGQRVQP